MLRLLQNEAVASTTLACQLHSHYHQVSPHQHLSITFSQLLSAIMKHKNQARKEMEEKSNR
jgi:hypothetical protein